MTLIPMYVRAVKRSAIVKNKKNSQRTKARKVKDAMSKLENLKDG